MMNVLQVHNERLPENALVRISAIIDDKRDKARLNPVKEFLLVLGDWNFHAPGESSTYLPTATTAEPTPDVQSNSTQRTCPILQTSLDQLTELAHPDPTHFYAPSNKVSRLDRIYTATPQWLLTKIKITAQATAYPLDYSTLNLSDHAP